jgi:hypothetical protein
MEQSSSWEANSRSASQEVLRLLLNPKVHNSPAIYIFVLTSVIAIVVTEGIMR